MNAITTPPLMQPRVLQPGAGTRRWLTLLLAVEGLAALAAALAFIAMAPDAGSLVAALGTTGGVALILLAGVSAVFAIMAFTTAASMIRRREGALSAAAALQATLAVAGLFAGLVNGFDQQIVAGMLVASIGLVLAVVAGRGADVMERAR
jgi:hypothetical protein